MRLVCPIIDTAMFTSGILAAVIRPIMPIMEITLLRGLSGRIQGGGTNLKMRVGGPATILAELVVVHH